MDKVVVFKDELGEYRWHRRSENGQVVATSGEGYVNDEHAVRMATELNPDAELVIKPVDRTVADSVVETTE